MTVHMTIELDETDEAQLRAIADHEKLSPEELVRKVVSERLEYDRGFREAVQKGMDDIAAGRFFTHEEVLARSAKRRAELLARALKREADLGGGRGGGPRSDCSLHRAG